MNRIKLQNILKRLTKFDDRVNGTFDFMDQELEKVKESLKETVVAKSIEEVNAEFKRLQIGFKPFLKAFEDLKKTLSNNDQELRSQLETRLGDLNHSLSNSNSITKDRIANILLEIETIQNKLQVLSQPQEIPDFAQQIQDTEAKLISLISTAEVQDMVNDQEIKKKIDELEEQLKKLRQETNNRISNLGGGSMNRQIFIGGADALTKYSDINLKAGSNVTLTYTNNNTTKRVDITITATGGGPGGGIVRSIQSISSSQAADATTGTDYVYVCSSTLTLTMSTCVGNTNLYTIKNAGTGVITINFNGVETGDGQTTLVMPVQYTSIDLSSDGVSNWQIT